MTLIPLTLLLICCQLTKGFIPSSVTASFGVISLQRQESSAASNEALLAVSSDDDEFAAFADSLEDAPAGKSSSTTATATQERKGVSSDKKTTTKREWQDKLEDLLDPLTPVSKRQSLFSDLLSSNQDIRSSVESAIRDRSIDPLLTTRGKRFRDGSRAVARQITSDIIPELIQQAGGDSNKSEKASSSTTPTPPLPIPPSPPSLSAVVPPVRDLERVGTRIFNALQNRFQSELETVQQDIQSGANPLESIPKRISKQSRTILQEASNVFAETPSGLKEPSYKVVAQTSDYEIRDYESYTTAATNIAPTDTSSTAASDSEDDDSHNNNNSNKRDQYSLAQNGAAFNTLAAYVFGANKDGLSMEMTTPITTTMSGEMRFYLALNDDSNDDDDATTPPEPLDQAWSTDVYVRPGHIWIQEIPPARLAVRRFTGFATKGEVMRQKEALLASLAMDDVVLDVPHGATVPHVVFQYNPPYTLPVLRRNEIAVAVSVPNSSGDTRNGSTDPNTSGSDDDAGFASSIRDSWEPVD